NYMISIGAMVLFSLILFKVLFKGEQNNIYFLLLIGMILGTFFSSFTTFMQVLIDPNEIMVAQDKMFASINNINGDLVYISIVVIALVTIYLLSFYKYLEVLALGKDESINLGVAYDYVVERLLVIVAILILVATELVVPFVFPGLLVVNLFSEIMKTFSH